MKPTVGRIVHFYTNDPLRQSNGVGIGPYAAIVTQVFTGAPYINLKVFLPFGMITEEGSVEECSNELERSRYWKWPDRV